MHVLVVSDTHGPRHWKHTPDALLPHLAWADLVLHAGDVCRPAVLDDLAAHAPVRVVMGNNDGADVAAWGATPTLLHELAGVRVAMVHIAGPKNGRARRVHGMFPDADLVVFGHSHQPWLTHEEVEGHRFVLLNPGSPTDKRREPVATCARVVLEEGVVVSVELVELPTPPPARARRSRSRAEDPHPS